MSKNIIITGCNSAIGEVITDICSQRSDYQIIATYNTEDERISQIKKRCTNIDYVKIDLTSTIPADSFTHASVVIHCAAKSFNTDVNSLDIYEFNTRSCKNVLTLANATNATNIIYLSSMSVYGDIATKIVDETTPCHSSDPYGLSKREGEIVFEKSYIPTVALRLPGVLAPRAERAWIPQCVKKLLRNEEIAIHNPHSPFNNVIEVYDLAHFIIQLIDQKWAGFHAFPIAAENAISIREVIQLLKDELNSSSLIHETTSNKITFNIDSQYARDNFSYKIPDVVASLKKYALQHRC